MTGMWLPRQNNLALKWRGRSAVPWDANTAGDRSALPLHRHTVLKILHDDDDHGLPDVVIKNHLLEVGFIRL
jgi:hypothetical protein